MSGACVCLRIPPPPPPGYAYLMCFLSSAGVLKSLVPSRWKWKSNLNAGDDDCRCCCSSLDRGVGRDGDSQGSVFDSSSVWFSILKAVFLIRLPFVFCLTPTPLPLLCRFWGLSGCLAVVQDMSAILEAYWLLAAKRFVDNVCMALDKKIMGAMAHKMQGTS